MLETFHVCELMYVCALMLCASDLLEYCRRKKSQILFEQTLLSIKKLLCKSQLCDLHLGHV